MMGEMRHRRHLKTQDRPSSGNTSECHVLDSFPAWCVRITTVHSPMVFHDLQILTWCWKDTPRKGEFASITSQVIWCYPSTWRLVMYFFIPSFIAKKASNEMPTLFPLRTNLEKKMFWSIIYILALVVDSFDNTFCVVSVPEATGTVLADGSFSESGSGRPGVWIREFTEEGRKCLTRRLVPTKGKLDDLLRENRGEIVGDFRVENCRKCNPINI